MKQDELGRFVKPIPGDYATAKKARKSHSKAQEREIMQTAQRMDGGKCRVPRCEFRHLKVDPAHLREAHRGQGGNPSGDRTTLATIISLCRRHHHLYDVARTLDIEVLEADKGFRGLCCFYLDGVHIGTEKRIGVSVTREAK